MNNNTNEIQAETKTQTKGNFVEPKVYLSKDGEFITLVLPGNQLVRKHVNYFKAIMKIPFIAKSQPEAQSA